MNFLYGVAEGLHHHAAILEPLVLSVGVELPCNDAEHAVLVHMECYLYPLSYLSNVATRVVSGQDTAHAEHGHVVHYDLGSAALDEYPAMAGTLSCVVKPQTTSQIAAILSQYEGPILGQQTPPRSFLIANAQKSAGTWKTRTKPT